MSFMGAAATEATRPMSEQEKKEHEDLELYKRCYLKHKADVMEYMKKEFPEECI
jgi:hypothetical protein